MKFIDSGDYKAAYVLLKGLSYKDSEEKLLDIKIKHECKQIVLEVADVGDTVFFGSYEQDNDTANGKEDIEWVVLAKEDNRLLLISDKTLDCKPYNASFIRVTWKDCTLREWLNKTFLSDAFSSEEQTKIQSTTVSADKNPQYDTNPGNATTDKVFLLSITEAEKYFGSNEARKCAPTAYAIAQGTYTSDDYETADGDPTVWWWLRSPGYIRSYAAYVNSFGSVYAFGNNVHSVDAGVRPAIWVSLE